MSHTSSPSESETSQAPLAPLPEGPSGTSTPDRTTEALSRTHSTSPTAGGFSTLPAPVAVGFPSPQAANATATAPPVAPPPPLVSPAYTEVQPPTLAVRTTTSTSLATMHAYILGEYTDARRWLVALRDPSQGSSTVDALSTHDINPQRRTEAGTEVPASPPPSSPTTAVPLLPLEQRLDVEDLQCIMKAFSDAVDLPTYLASLRLMLEKKRREQAESAVATATQAGSCGGHWEQAFASALDTTRQGRPVPPTGEEGPLNTISTTAGGAMVQNAAEDASGSVAPVPPVVAARRTAEDLTHFLLSVGPAADQALSGPSTFTRALSLDTLTDVMRVVIPSVTPGEVRDLMTRVDYEAHGTIAWTDLATYLVSESRHHVHMALAKTELDPVTEPRNVPRAECHESITSQCVDTRKRVLITGGSEGTVRAWGLSDLRPRGLIFSNKHWISGVHCGHRSRYLFIATLDRELFVLDGLSYEVVRVYHGRSVADNAAGMTYAAETLRTVRVGGAKPPSAAATAPAGSARVASVTPRTHRHGEAPQDFQDVLTGGGDANGGWSAAGLIPGMGSRTLTATMAQQALVSTDSAPLTSSGRGPYVDKRLTEGVLVGLVDSVTCSLYIHTALDEDVVLLGTSRGEVHLFVPDMQKTVPVLRPRRCLPLHPDKAINKMEVLTSLDALVTCADDGTVRMTSLINAQTLRVFGPSGVLGGHSAVLDVAVCATSQLLVTVGPERSGLVWDFSQETPIAVLEAHNSPCRSCVILAQQQRILTTAADGTVSVFDMGSFHRVQSIGLGAGHVVRRLLADEVRQRCVGLGHHPFALRVKRQTTSACPPQYTGPVATMFTSLYTAVFDTIVTVDQDRMVMTWSRKTGKNLFAFLLKDFSVSDAMNQLRLTAASLDELGRRLLTGFHSGVVVVWNAVNGQPLNLITAATEEEERQGIISLDKRRNAPTSGLTRAATATASTSTSATHNHKLLASSHGQRPASRPGVARSEGAAGLLSSRPAAVLPPSARSEQASRREVTAVGSLVRTGATYLLFAANRTLFTVPDSTTFTVASATRWSTPESYGDITTIAQVSSQSVVCGTSHGALFFYNVLQEKQEGATQYATEVVFSVVAGGGGASSSGHGHTTHTARRGSTRARAGSLMSGVGGLTSTAAQSLGGSTIHAFSAWSATDDGMPAGDVNGAAHAPAHTPHQGQLAALTSHVTTLCVGTNGNTCVSYSRPIRSRVTRLLPLRAVSPHLLLSLHADGTVALWQTLRRTYLGSLNLVAAGVDEGTESGGAVVAAVNARGTHLVFADEGGNVHVCAMAFRRLEPGSVSETAVMTADNPALYLKESAVRTATGHRDAAAPAAAATVPNVLNNTTKDKNDAEAERATGTPRAIHEEDRVLYVPETFARVGAFGTGLTHIVSLLVLDPKMEASHETTTPPSSPVPSGPTDATTAHTPSARSEPIVVCTDQEHYTRVFTLRGDVIGELGMGEWDLGDPKTYSCMGQCTAELPSTRIPYTRLSGEESDEGVKAALFFDYLTETYAAQQEARRQAMSAATARRSRGRSQTQGATLRRSSLCSTTGTGVGVVGPAVAAASWSPNGPGASSHPPSPSRPPPASAAPLASPPPPHVPTAGSALLSSLKETFAGPGDVTTPRDAAADHSAAVSPTTTGQPPSRPLATTMAKSARIRSGVRGLYRGLVKRDHAAFVRRQAAATATTTTATVDGRSAPVQAHTAPSRGVRSTNEETPEAGARTDRLELQAEFLVLLSRASTDASGKGAVADSGRELSLTSPVLPTASAGAEGSERDGTTTSWAKGSSLATTAVGEGVTGTPPSIATPLSSMRITPPAALTSPPRPEGERSATKASVVDGPGDSAGVSSAALPQLPHTTAVAAAGATPSVFARSPVRAGLGFARPQASTGCTPGVLATSAVTAAMTTTTSRRHKPGGTSVAVRPDSATLQADAHKFAETMLNDRRERILNSTVNAATLRALREVDGEDSGDSATAAAPDTPGTAASGGSSAARPNRGLVSSGLSDDLGPTLTPMHAQVNDVLRRRLNRQHNSGIAATLYGNSGAGLGTSASARATALSASPHGASSFAEQVASKMYVAPMPTLPTAPAHSHTKSSELKGKRR